MTAFLLDHFQKQFHLVFGLSNKISSLTLHYCCSLSEVLSVMKQLTLCFLPSTLLKTKETDHLNIDIDLSVLNDNIHKDEVDRVAQENWLQEGADWYMLSTHTSMHIR